MWILTTYAEKSPDGDFPNYKHNLGDNLKEALIKAALMFDEKVTISILNFDEESVDFTVKRGNISIGDIEEE